jgi:hypothetical protein
MEFTKKGIAGLNTNTQTTPTMPPSLFPFQPPVAPFPLEYNSFHDLASNECHAVGGLRGSDSITTSAMKDKTTSAASTAKQKP